MAGTAKKRAPRSKRLPKEIKTMVDGGVNLLSIIIALVAAICALATKLGKSDAEAVAAIHRLSQPGGKATIAKMAEVVLGGVAKQVVGGFATTYDQSVGLIALIKRALGSANLGNINPDITPERFPLAGDGIRSVRLAVMPYLNGETSELPALRLVAAGHILANTGDLAAFLHDHPGEVAKWARVLAISEDSRWADSDGDVYVPCARVDGAHRIFGLGGFRGRLLSRYGVLVVLPGE